MATVNEKIANALNEYTPLVKNYVSLHGGEENVIESIIVNGAAIPIEGKIANISISGGETNSIENISVSGGNVSLGNKTAIITLDDYAKKSELSGIFRYKGGVASFESLPTENAVGDVWNVSQGGGTDKDGVTISSGDNVVWTDGGGWDNLGGAFDLSGFVSIESGKGLSTNDYTDSDKTKLASIESGAQVNVLEGIIVNGETVSIDNKFASFTVGGGIENVIENISIVGGNVSIDSATKTANITVSGGSGDGLQNISVDDVLAEVNTETKVASITLPRASEENLDDTSNNLATAGFVNAIIRRLVGNAPEALDTLGEIAAALNNDKDLAATLMNAIAEKQDSLNVTTFAQKLLQCNSAAMMRNYWAGIYDIDFDECGKSWTAVGSPYMVMNNPKFGAKCAVFDGNGYVYRYVALAADSNFSIECFARPYNTSTGCEPFALFLGNGNRLKATLDTNGKFYFVIQCNGESFMPEVEATLNNEWYYISLIKSAVNDTESRLNLQIVDSSGSKLLQEEITVSFVGGSYKLFAGTGVNASGTPLYQPMYLDEFRISNVLRDVSSVPTAPFVADENTLSLLHFNG